MCHLPMSFDLPETKAYAVRRLTWMGTPGQLHDGVMTLTLQKRGGRKLETESYLTQLVRAEGGGFDVLLSKKSEPVEYQCRRVESGYVCDCKAALCRLGCRHVDALMRLEAEGVLGVDAVAELDRDPAYSSWRQECDAAYETSVMAIG